MGTTDQIVTDESTNVQELVLGEDLLLYVRSAAAGGRSCVEQIEALEAVLRHWGVLGPDEELPKEGNLHRPDLGLYVDEAMSGRKPLDERPGTREILEHVRAHEQDSGSPGYVLTRSRTRYGRFPNGSEQLICEINRLRKRGWRLVSVRESRLDNGDQQKLMQVIGTVLSSELETSPSEVRSVRITRGKDVAIEQGN